MKINNLTGKAAMRMGLSDEANVLAWLGKATDGHMKWKLLGTDYYR